MLTDVLGHVSCVLKEQCKSIAAKKTPILNKVQNSVKVRGKWEVTERKPPSASTISHWYQGL